MGASKAMIADTDTNKAILELLKNHYLMRGGQLSIENNLINYTGQINYMPKDNVKSTHKQPLQWNHVGADFMISATSLNTLEGSPNLVGGTFSCAKNNLQNLLHAPRVVMKNFNCSGNPLDSLEGLPSIVHGTVMVPDRANLPLLRLLEIKGCSKIEIRDKDGKIIESDLSKILNKYLGQGRPGMLPCANEMLKAGYGSNARR